jgi:hypothetical protein
LDEKLLGIKFEKYVMLFGLLLLTISKAKVEIPKLLNPVFEKLIIGQSSKVNWCELLVLFFVVKNCESSAKSIGW